MDGFDITDILDKHMRDLAAQAGTVRAPWRDLAGALAADLAAKEQERQNRAEVLDAAIEGEDTGRDNPPGRNAQPVLAVSPDSLPAGLAVAVLRSRTPLTKSYQATGGGDIV
jgi:hypothetical protein